MTATVSLADPEFIPLPAPQRYPGQPGTRLLRMVERDLPFEVDDSGCYVWTGPVNQGGYGTARFYRKLRNAHRAVWLDTVGQLPDELELDHLCRNKRCINPDHMEPVTPAENRRRQMRARTSCKHGHEYTPESTRYAKNGSRFCGICRKGQEGKSTAPHGSPARYRWGNCRCEPCRSAERERRRPAPADRFGIFAEEEGR